MSRTVAILPVKSFDRGKQRLGIALDHATRQALIGAMFSDVLVALGRTRGIEAVLVVSGDRAVQRIAMGYGAAVLEDDHEGHNQAASRGIIRAIQLGAERALLVPGDCPLLDHAELDALIELPAAAPSVLIVPDRHGTGTNALLITPPEAFTPAFGVGSRARHERQAADAGLSSQTVPVASLALDVDTPEDLAAIELTIASRRGGGAHTRGMLLQLARSRRP